jgi:hypothetical protein
MPGPTAQTKFCRGLSHPSPIFPEGLGEGPEKAEDGSFFEHEQKSRFARFNTIPSQAADEGRVKARPEEGPALTRVSPWVRIRTGSRSRGPRFPSSLVSINGKRIRTQACRRFHIGHGALPSRWALVSSGEGVLRRSVASAFIRANWNARRSIQKGKLRPAESRSHSTP